MVFQCNTRCTVNYMVDYTVDYKMDHTMDYRDERDERDETYGMVIAAFSVEDEAGRVCFFEETLLANVSMNVVLGMPFFTPSNADVRFSDRELHWQSYDEALPTTRRRSQPLR